MLVGVIDIGIGIVSCCYVCYVDGKIWFREVMCNIFMVCLWIIFD